MAAPEHAVTYDNGVSRRRSRRTALERTTGSASGSIGSRLAAAQTALDGHLTLIGNDGWRPRGDCRRV
jgi:hypothetical protein